MKDEKKKHPPETEPKVKLYRLTIEREFEATSIDEARTRARKEIVMLGQAGGKEEIEEKVGRVVRAKYSSRADRLDEARSMIADAKSIVEELKSEVEEWHDNLPENFQDGDKGQALEECKDNLESVESSLDEAESNCDGVEFPGMFD